MAMKNCKSFSGEMKRKESRDFGGGMARKNCKSFGGEMKRKVRRDFGGDLARKNCKSFRCEMKRNKAKILAAGWRGKTGKFLAAR